jgi:DNA polymerase III sliding clamp (beta) subunit (PCNA family)
MRIRIEPKALLRELSVVHAIQGKADVIHLMATANGLNISGSNGDTKVTVNIEAVTLVNPGYATAPRTKLRELIRLLSCEDFALASEEEHVIVEEESSNFKAKFVKPVGINDPPGLTSFLHTVQADAEQLRELLAKTQYAMPDTDMSADGKCGLQLSFNDQEQKAVALNGHVLALHKTSRPNGNAGVLTLNRRTVRYLDALLEDMTGPVDINIAEKGILVTVGRRTLQAPLQAINFPDLTKVFAAPAPTVVVFHRAPFRQALRRVTATNERIDRCVSLRIGPTSIDLRAGEGEGSHDSVEATSNATELVEVKLNCDYLATAIDTAGTDEIKLRLGPGMVGISTDQSDFIIAPMR